MSSAVTYLTTPSEPLSRPGAGPAAVQARLDLTDLLLATGRPAAAGALRQIGPQAELARGRAAEAAGDLRAARQLYRQDGAAGMADRSSRPHSSPRRTPVRAERRIVKLRVRQDSAKAAAKRKKKSQTSRKPSASA